MLGRLFAPDLRFSNAHNDAMHLVKASPGSRLIVAARREKAAHRWRSACDFGPECQAAAIEATI